MFNFAQEMTAVTKLAIKVAKSGSLTRLLASAKDVFETFNQFFLGCLLAWFSEQRQSPGHVDWKALEDRLRRSPEEVVEQSVL